MTGAMTDLLNQYPDGLDLFDVWRVERLVRDQALDILIFSFRLWHVHKRREALKLFSHICLFLPLVLADLHFWKILKYLSRPTK